ncbi:MULTISPECIES: hypothetical protein [Stenotrophomonas]|uniref:hypothetical protein n=1 Tax=Stenotrophomonas TaxID=40323 RepID=UPI00131F415A|nr:MULTISPECIES: hypothetical protein [Stenotrophomonas]
MEGVGQFAHGARVPLPRAHASDGTVHVTADPRGLFEERYDLRFDAQGRLFQVDYWIAC